MDKWKNIYIGLCVVLVLLCASAGVASAQTWYVDDDGGADFTSVQAAVNAASPSDTIIVKDGNYYENIIINKQLTLRGYDYPIISGSNKGIVIRITANRCVLEGFKVVNGGSYLSGINVESNNNFINDNIISSNYHGIRTVRKAVRAMNWVEVDSSNNKINNNYIGDGIILESSNNTGSLVSCVVVKYT